MAYEDKSNLLLIVFALYNLSGKFSSNWQALIMKLVYTCLGLNSLPTGTLLLGFSITNPFRFTLSTGAYTISDLLDLIFLYVIPFDNASSRPG